MKKPSEISDYHERLGVTINSDDQEIKTAYRKLAIEYHPDKNLGREEESKLEFIAVSEAYENLSKKISESPNANFNYYQKEFFNEFRNFEEVREMFFKYEKYLLESESTAAKTMARIMGKFFRGGF